MPALGLLIVATLGITNDVDGGFVTDNNTWHYSIIMTGNTTLFKFFFVPLK
jgi:hypothetical protein